MVKVKQTYRLMELGKLTSFELICLFGTIFSPLLLLLVPTFLTVLGIVGLLVFNVWLIFKSDKNQRKKPILFRGLQVALVSYVVFLLLTYFITYHIGIKNEFILGFLIICCFFAYLFALGIVTLYLLNTVYIYVLKKIFPKHSENLNEQQKYPKLRTLSQFIDLTTQKLYLSLLLIDLFLYLLLIGFIMVIIFKHSDGESGSSLFILSGIIQWAKQQGEVFSVFNAVGLLSLILTIYSITFPKRNEIVRNAIDKQQKRYQI
ncbi:hypothetical protein ERJ70_03735 [Sediminibacillus dalangtanensis]|uniref:Glycerophosphoryl diester phosphodiesterase membrane domain-containing protein n=1 Tax=Sediminibacillus dalangtanensis TaxID=2729421 RepID=A0ABX7VPS1_9BACI|nr:hypothetical protein [Sediminibacillus dalangtanensis]QTM98483.1 hypothetical protein ERJ70_03735 [Sediminibacillus dalangtanensis]